jgi:type III secretion protein C
MSTHAFRAPRRGLLALPLCAALCGAVIDARATPIPWDTRGKMPPIVARDMPVQEFMQALLSPQSINVIVSPAAAQRVVNGRFSGNASKAFDTVVVSSSLLPYFDGSNLYLFASSETQRKVVNVPPASAQRLVSTLNQMRLHDGRYNLFTAVPSSGFIQLTGAKPFVDQVQEVVRSVQLSAPTSPDQIAVFPLKHAWAWDVTLASAGKPIVVPGIASLLRTLLGVNGGITAVVKQRASVPKLRGKGFAAGVQSDASTDPEPLPIVEGAEESPRGGFGGGAAGGPTVTAEIRSNSVVVRDTPDRLPRYADLIKALDVEPMMVELETTIVDVNDDQLQELGVNWRLNGSRNEIRLGNGTNSDLALRGPTPGDVTPFARGVAWSTVLDAGRLIARVTALAATGNARIVSRAQVATLANLESSIQSNQTAYVRVGGFQEVDLFPVSAATSVRITPQVFARGDRNIISMVVAIRDGSFSDAVVDQIPTVKEISLSTNGLVAENQTFVIGGFRQETNSNRTDKIPILGDLPGIGALFRTTSDQKVKAERLFLVTPKVVSVSRLLEMGSFDPNAPTSQLKPPAPRAENLAQAPTSKPAPSCWTPEDGSRGCRTQR